jgi:multidrug resistance efflux pump
VAKKKSIGDALALILTEQTQAHQAEDEQQAKVDATRAKVAEQGAKVAEQEAKLAEMQAKLDQAKSVWKDMNG